MRFKEGLIGRKIDKGEQEEEYNAEHFDEELDAGEITEEEWGFKVGYYDA